MAMISEDGNGLDAPRNASTEYGHSDEFSDDMAVRVRLSRLERLPKELLHEIFQHVSFEQTGIPHLPVLSRSLSGVQRASAFERLSLDIKELDLLFNLLTNMDNGMQRRGSLIKSLDIRPLPHSQYYQGKSDYSTLSTLLPRLHTLRVRLNCRNPLNQKLVEQLGSFLDLQEIEITSMEASLLPRILDARKLKNVSICTRIARRAVPVAPKIPDERPRLLLDYLTISAISADAHAETVSFLDSVEATAVSICMANIDLSSPLSPLRHLSPTATLHLNIVQHGHPLSPSLLSPFANLRSLELAGNQLLLKVTFFTELLDSLKSLETLTLGDFGRQGGFSLGNLHQALSVSPPSLRLLSLNTVGTSLMAGMVIEGLQTETDAQIREDLSKNLSQLIKEDGLFHWPVGYSEKGVKEIITLGSERGMKVVGKMVDAINFAVERREMLEERKKLREMLTRMDNNIKKVEGEMAALLFN